MAEPVESNASTPSSARSDDGDPEEIPKKPEATSNSKLECPVCLQTCVHPVRLPCGHIFCFLCVKGVAFKNLRCAMCRCDIPLTYLDHPQLVNGVEEIVKAATAPDGNAYRWYYEGCQGWWQYDERTSQELEEAFLRGEKSCKILVAGFVYIVTFEHKCQIRQNDYSRIRRVKRDLVTIPKKGVAGLRLESNTGNASTSDMNELSSAMGEMNLNEGASTSAAGVPNVPEGRGFDEPDQSDLPDTAAGVSESEDSTGQLNEPQDVPCISTTATVSPSSSSSNTSSRSSASGSAMNRRMQQLLDLDRREYSASDSDDDGSDTDENLLVL